MSGNRVRFAEFIYPALEYWKHIEEFHSKTRCQICDIDFDARRYRSHMLAHGLSEDFIVPSNKDAAKRVLEKRANKLTDHISVSFPDFNESVHA